MKDMVRITTSLDVVITNENVYLADKERSSNMTAKLS